eukprot:gene8326-11267_t
MQSAPHSGSNQAVWAIGLMTGTALDGFVDTALIRTDGISVAEFGPFELFAYSDADRVLLAESITQARAWDFQGPEPAIFAEAEDLITRIYAGAVHKLLDKANLLPDEIAFVGGHGVTDRPFRQLCKKLGAGHAVSEMAASNPALWKTDKSTRRLNHYGETKPIAVQIAGADPEMMAHAAAYNIERGAQIIDINMGCPAKKVCAVAAGSALLGVIAAGTFVAGVLVGADSMSRAVGVPTYIAEVPGHRQDFLVVGAALHDHVHLDRPQPGLLRRLDAVEHVGHGEVHVVHAPEDGVVDAIEAHGDTLQAGVPKRLRFLAQKRPIGGEGQVQRQAIGRAQLAEHRNQVLDALAQQGLAAGQSDLLHPV